MRRAELEHAIRAATEIVAADQVIVIGSQSILGSFDEDDLPPDATMSIEVDIVPLNDDEAESLATRLDGALGEWSMFHETHGFYVQGVGQRTAVLPDGWQERLVTVQGPGTNGRIGLCLEPHDVCVAKLAAAREKDFRFVHALLAHGVIREDVLAERASQLSNAPEGTRQAVGQWIDTNRAVRRDSGPSL